MANKGETMKGYKGFDKDMRCRGMQFDVGKTYEVPDAVLCEKGLHFCERSIDTFAYYPPGEGSRYCEIEALGVISDVAKGVGKDSKRCSTVLRVVREMTLAEMIVASACEAAWNHDDGDYSAASSNGDESAASSNGYSSAASSNGDESIACALGVNSRARGALGNWIVVAQRSEGENYGHIETVLTAKVDGETIKAGTWYTARGGMLVEANYE